MSEMVTRVCKAMRLDPSHTEHRAMARAAIQAMRDPTWEMMQAMYEAMFVDKWDATQAAMIGAGFEAAIDTALAEPVG